MFIISNYVQLTHKQYLKYPHRVFIAICLCFLRTKQHPDQMNLFCSNQVLGLVLGDGHERMAHVCANSYNFIDDVDKANKH